MKKMHKSFFFFFLLLKGREHFFASSRQQNVLKTEFKIHSQKSFLTFVHESDETNVVETEIQKFKAKSLC